MKEMKKVEIFYGLKGSTKLMPVLFGILFTCLTSCSKDDINEVQVEESVDLKHSLRAASTGTSIEEITFTAVAMVEYCHGENIRFTGTIENRVTKTTDAKGVIHYTRSFRTKGMTGTGVDSGTEYDVLGGAEMFAVKDAVFNSDGTWNLSKSLAESDIFIHQGTLVFRNRSDGSKFVARHIIRKVPGQDVPLNVWKCAG